MAASVSTGLTRATAPIAASCLTASTHTFLCSPLARRYSMRFFAVASFSASWGRYIIIIFNNGIQMKHSQSKPSPQASLRVHLLHSFLFHVDLSQWSVGQEAPDSCV